MKDRRSRYDVTNSVCLENPKTVLRAVHDLYFDLYPEENFQPLAHAFWVYGQMYSGAHPDFLGCDTWYHDTQHSLDVTLAMMRIIDGHDRSVPVEQRFGGRRAMLGLIIAIFHDMGYVRQTRDVGISNGAAFTLNHVARGADFLTGYLPQVGYQDEVEIASEIIHYTGFERELDTIKVDDPRDEQLGWCLATVDLLAQMSDRCYLEKCRDFLYREFEYCGLAGPSVNGSKPMYSSPDDLLEKTPSFNNFVWTQRLDGFFEKAYRHLDAHFGEPNPYVETVQSHMHYLSRVLDRHETTSRLRRHPPCIQAARLRNVIAENQLRVM